LNFLQPFLLKGFLSYRHPKRSKIYPDYYYILLKRCFPMLSPKMETSPVEPAGELQKKLWVYTNYDCNLSCSYCVAASHPRAARRGLPLEIVQRLCDEAQALQFEQVYFTGGEPFILPEIFAMLAYSCEKFPTTVLTNAILFNNGCLDKLKAIHHERLVIQVSLDGSKAEQHDPYRGNGSWSKTVAGLHALLEGGFNVRLSTTQTSANSAHTEEICEYHRFLGIPEADHIIRPLAKRGFSQQGLEVGKYNLSPEITVSANGVYWHPLSTDPDLLVSDQIFPLADAVCRIQAELQSLRSASQAKLNTFE
jgi:sulfatase maturation enzyme AslB (radical SAM superfamily)